MVGNCFTNMSSFCHMKTTHWKDNLLPQFFGMAVNRTGQEKRSPRHPKHNMIIVLLNYLLWVNQCTVFYISRPFFPNVCLCVHAGHGFDSLTVYRWSGAFVGRHLSCLPDVSSDEIIPQTGSN